MPKMTRRTLPTDNFTILSNDWIRDEELPWAARGLLAWLASHKAGFEITETTITEAGPLGRDGVRKMISDLETAGYLRRDREYLPGGGSVVDYVLCDPGDDAEDGEPATPSDQGEQDLFAAQTDDGSATPPTSSQENKKKTKTTTSSRRRTATRLPEDFQPDEKMRAWFAAEKLGQIIDGRMEHDQFVDFWIAEAGPRARKLDWAAAWRRWMRKAASHASSRRPYGAPGTSIMPAGGPMHPIMNRPSTTDLKVAQTLELGRRIAQQMEESA
jgi:hypothetical protein